MPTFYCNYFFAWNSGAPYTRGPWTLPTLPAPLLRHCRSSDSFPNSLNLNILTCSACTDLTTSASDALLQFFQADSYNDFALALT